jgi:hypothetical protein
MQQITFYQRFEADILSGKKTITIRGASEKNYIPGKVVQASTHKDGRKFARLEIVSVDAIEFKQLNKAHAKQENMSLAELQAVIQEIYPNTQELYTISFRVFNNRVSF